MKCPHCSADSWAHIDRDPSVLRCTSCGLAGPRDVLEALAARLAPAGVLDEAERLLRAAGVRKTRFYYLMTAVIASDDVYEQTLAEAYAELTGGNHGRS